MNVSNKNDVKQLVNKIESLAKNLGTLIDSGTEADVLSTATALVGTNATFIFTLGEFYALEGMNKKVPVKVVKVKNLNYHNMRDRFGRFVSKP